MIGTTAKNIERSTGENTATQQVEVKSEFDGDIRRFVCDASIDELFAHIARLYQLQPNSFRVTYRDDEGDMVTLASNEDLGMAIRTGAQCLRVQVQASQASQPPCATEAGITVPYVLKRSKEKVQLSLNKAMVVALKMDTMAPTEFEEAIASLRLGKLVRLGLVDKEEAIRVCKEKGVLPPRVCRPEYHQRHRQDSPAYTARALLLSSSEDEGAEQVQEHHQREEAPVPLPGRHHGRHGRHRHEPSETLDPHDPGHHRGGHRGRGRGGRGGRGHHKHREEHAGDRDRDSDKDSEAKRPSRKLMARFVKHISTPDGTTIAPGATFEKTWRFRNDSSAAWPSQCELVAVGDDAIPLAGSASARGSVPPGQEADVTVQLVAPLAAGFYQSYYRLREVGGRKFGQRVWVSITVPGSSSSESEDFVAVEATSVGEPAVPDAFETALKQLEAMGFADQSTNVQLLQRYRGNVERVVARLSGDQ